MNSGYFRLLAGLGNPGSKYNETRHNLGFMALEKLAEIERVSFSNNKKLLGQIAEIGLGASKRRLLMPNTFMNESGRSIRAAMDWFDIKTDQLLVIVDDIDLPLGKIRFRERGGSGGHNGLKSIIKHLGTETFSRIRIGIGSPKNNDDASERKERTVSHVLGSFSNSEKKIIESVLKEIIDNLELLENFGLTKGAEKLNSYKYNYD